MRRLLIEGILTFKKKNYFSLYREFVKEQRQPLEVLQQKQLEQFKILFNYSKEYVPYYSKLFNKLKLFETDFKSLKDLDKIPILEKHHIINHYNDFQPKKIIEPYQWGSTGGSTGESLKYRISYSCGMRNAAILNRGFNYADYTVGDKMAIIAGSSLMNKNKSLYDRINYFLYNKRAFSSYGMTENDFVRIYKELIVWQPQFIRGYASSLTLFANYIESKNLDSNFNKLKAIFSTAEMLSERQRRKIESVFNVPVYNQYGLNDGGITAFEDNIKPGMLIDTERGVLETVDDTGKQIIENQGKILATSLYNYAFPFIRYNTNDIGTVTSKYSDDSSPRLRLINLSGRQTDYIIINNQIIGSPVLTVLMGKVDTSRYQIIQKNKNQLIIKIEKGKGFNKEQESFIKQSLFNNLGEFDLIFDYSGVFQFSNNKFKFIINEFKTE